MASMAWMDLMAPELKSDRESAIVWRALVASQLFESSPLFCFFFFQRASCVQ